MTRIHRIGEFAILIAFIIFAAWLSLRRDPTGSRLRNLTTIICTPSRSGGYCRWGFELLPSTLPAQPFAPVEGPGGEK